MAILFSLNFSFEQVEFACLVRIKIIDNERIFKITVMNGELERLLYGQNCIKEINGMLEMPADLDVRQGKLKYEIALALQHHLEMMDVLHT